MELKTKEELVREEWGKINSEVLDLLKDSPDFEFILSTGRICWYDFDFCDQLGLYDELSSNGNIIVNYDNDTICPVSLKDLENNNGWTIIEDDDNSFPDADLNTEYWVFDDDGDIMSASFTLLDSVDLKPWNDLKETEGITHYQVKPPKPKLPLHK